MFQYLVSGNVSIPRVCLQRTLSLRSYMKVYIETCRFDEMFSSKSNIAVENVYSLDNCINHITHMTPNSILISHDNYTTNYPGHHIITSYPEACPRRCRHLSFDLKIYRKFDDDGDRVDVYSARIGEMISTQRTYDSIWIKINKQETPCATGECTQKVSDEDELSVIDLNVATSRR